MEIYEHLIETFNNNQFNKIRAIKYDKYDKLNKYIYMEAIQQNILVLKYISKEIYEYLEICKLAVQQNSYALQYVKEEFKTDEILKLAAKRDSNWFYKLGSTTNKPQDF